MDELRYGSGNGFNLGRVGKNKNAMRSVLMIWCEKYLTDVGKTVFNSTLKHVFFFICAYDIQKNYGVPINSRNIEFSENGNYVYQIYTLGS